MLIMFVKLLLESTKVKITLQLSGPLSGKIEGKLSYLPIKSLEL